MTDTKQPIETTYYFIRDDGVEEDTREGLGDFEVRIFEHRPGEKWLVLNDGPYSLKIDSEAVENTSEHGWLAQAGTKPVCIDGVWGGRNYPRIWVPATSMAAVWMEIKHHAAQH